MKKLHHLMAKDIFGCLTTGEQEELRLLCREKGITAEQYESMKRLIVSQEFHKNILHSRRRPKRLNHLFRYAALFMLPLSVAIYFLYQKHDPVSISPETTMGHILPHQKTEQELPRLILANGEVVKLETADTQRIVSSGILNTGKTLEYQPEPASGTTDILRFNTIFVPQTGEYNVRLSDGTRVWLNENTRLKYPEAFSAATREIYLEEGEIYLEVAKDPAHPFTVHTPNGQVEVLGTHFNIRCYTPQQVETTLAEGSVKINASGKEVILQPGQQALVSDRIEVKEVDIEEVICWKDNLFFFKDIPLETILEKLADWYGFELFWQNPGLKTIRYYICIDKYASINEILNKLSEVNEIHFNIQGKTVTVSK